MKRLLIRLSEETSVGISDLLLGLGAGAVSEEEVESGNLAIYAYFEEKAELEEVIATVRDFLYPLNGIQEAPRFETSYIHPEDWEGWKSYLKPVRASRRIVIKPPWEKLRRTEGETKVVEINPATAFGTGHHETTRICISYLDQLLEKSSGYSVFDVGCGSGVLGICSIFLGASISFCADIDPNAARETVLNSARNGISEKVKVWCGSLDCTLRKFDVVVSNTSKETLVSIKDSLRKRLASSGFLIISGIQASEKRLVSDIYISSGYDIVSEKIEGDWAGLLLRPTEEGAKK